MKIINSLTIAFFLISINLQAQDYTQVRKLVKLKVGDSRSVTLYDGTQATIKILDVVYSRDKVRKAIREARIHLDVDGEEKWIVAGNYNLPDKFEKVKIDCPFVKEYFERARSYPEHAWRLGDNDVLLRVWPVNDPVNPSGLVHYFVNQKWAISNTTVVLEPVEEDGDALHPNNYDDIYYHWGVDIVGVKNITEVLAAGDGEVIGVGENYNHSEPIFKEVPARFERIFVKMPNGWVYRYSHLDDSRFNVTLGQKVKGGDPIAFLSDIWGGFSHVHFEIWSLNDDGQYVLEPAYPYIWESYMSIYKPEIIGVARPHKYIVVGDSVKLDGIKSVSFKGEIVKYEWTFENGDTASGAEVYRKFDEPGYFSEILKVTDDKGNIGYETVQVMVVYDDEPGQPYGFAMASYYPSFNNKPGEEITFKGRVFNTMYNGKWDYSEEHWDFGDGTTATSTSSPNSDWSEYAILYHTYDIPGHYIVTYSKTSQDGMTSTIKLHVDVAEAVRVNNILQNDLLIYPSPSQDEINISLTQNYTRLKTSIYDMSGRRVKMYDMTNSGNNIKINVSTVPNGVYFCEVQSNNQIIGTNKIIINK